MGKNMNYISDHFYKAKLSAQCLNIAKNYVSRDYSFRSVLIFNNSSFLVFNYMMFQMISYHSSRIRKLPQSLF